MSDNSTDEAVQHLVQRVFDGAPMHGFTPAGLRGLAAILLEAAERLEPSFAPVPDPATWKPHLDGEPLTDDHRTFLARLSQQKGPAGRRWTAAIAAARTKADGKELKQILQSLPDPEPPRLTGMAPLAPKNGNGHGHTPTRRGR